MDLESSLVGKVPACMHEDLSLIPRTHIRRKLGMVGIVVPHVLHFLLCVECIRSGRKAVSGKGARCRRQEAGGSKTFAHGRMEGPQSIVRTLLEGGCECSLSAFLLHYHISQSLSGYGDLRSQWLHNCWLVLPVLVGTVRRYCHLVLPLACSWLTLRCL